MSESKTESSPAAEARKLLGEAECADGWFASHTYEVSAGQHAIMESAPVVCRTSAVPFTALIAAAPRLLAALADENERLTPARADAVRALSTLENYGQHHSWCHRTFEKKCDCGLDTAVAELRASIWADGIAATASESLAAALTPQPTPAEES